MGLFPFFNKTKKTGKDSTVQSNELLNDDAASLTTEDVQTSLSYHPSWTVPKEQQYVFSFLSNELDPLKPNQISLSGIDIDQSKKGDWLVKAFFRSSLSQPVTMGPAELLLLGANDEVLAAKEFDLAELGEIPARSDRPWVFTFEKNVQRVEQVPTEGWKIAFNVQSLVPHQLDLEQTWKDALSTEQQDSLKQIVSSLPKLKDREVNFSGFQIKAQDEGHLAVSLFIRNGHSQHITLEQLPLELLDAQGQMIARGSFKLDKLQVKANTSKPWTFIFPKEMILIEQPDLSKWTIRVPQQ
ncbi:MAG: accessory Sec system S-layer assembly protein [Paenisporosarcina sp.]|nr:accessory Sec system S-layer assembly protein [Paenisporosarcina sp.]